MAVVKRTKKKKDEGQSKGSDQFVSGAAYKEEIKSDPNKMVRPKLYVQGRIIELVDQARVPPSRIVKVSQNQWIIEAIVEKLEREGITV